MLRPLFVGALNSGLVSARKHDTALELVGDEGAWRSAEKLDEPDVARDPVGGPLRRRYFGVRVVRRSHHRDEQRARKLGNTELLDDDLVPFPGEQQWEVRAQVRRIDPATVERVVADAAREGGVLGVRTSSTDDDATPWLVTPVRKHQPVRVAVTGKELRIIRAAPAHIVGAT